MISLRRIAVYQCIRPEFNLIACCSGDRLCIFTLEKDNVGMKPYIMKMKWLSSFMMVSQKPSELLRQTLTFIVILYVFTFSTCFSV